MTKKVTVSVTDDGFLEVTPSDGLSQIEAVGMLDVARVFVLSGFTPDETP